MRRFWGFQRSCPEITLCLEREVFMGLFGGTTELGAVSKHSSSRQGLAFGFMQLRGAPSISESSWAYTAPGPLSTDGSEVS